METYPGIHLFAMTTAIISALPEEQAGLLQLLSNKEHITHIPRRLSLGLIHEKPVILTLAGVGKVAAAMTATMLIERYKVQRIIFTGVAGAVAAHVEVGDVVVGTEYLQHDMDASPLFPPHEIPYTGISRFKADDRLNAIVLEALHAVFMPATPTFDLISHLPQTYAECAAYEALSSQRH